MSYIVTYGIPGLTGLIAVIHFAFAYAEFKGRNSSEFYAKFDIALAADQRVDQIGRIIVNAALFNALIALGLVATFFLGESGDALRTYFLVSIFVAGIVGGLTLKRSVLYIQSGPAALCLLMTFLG